MVIGVSDYDLGLQELDFCKNDGSAVKEILKKLGYEIKENNLLIGSIPGTKMRDEIFDFFKDESIKSDDTILFYYSGHGVPDADTVFLAATDTDPNLPSKRGFSFDELTKLMNSCISTKIVSVLDCCYSGSAQISKSSDDEAVLGTKLINKNSNRLQQSGEGKCLLAASLSYQQAFGMKKGGQSVFTHYLIEGLKGEQDAINKNGNITPDSLGKYLYHKVTKVFPNQKPIRKVEASGEIILASYPDLVENFDPKLQKKIDIKITIDEANNFFKIGEYNKALINYNSIIEQDQDNIDAWNNKGNTYEKLLMYNEAKECYERILEINSKDHLTWFNKGNTLLKLRRFKDALECYDSALKLNPEDPDYWYNKGITFLELDKEKEGKDCIKKSKNLTK